MDKKLNLAVYTRELLKIIEVKIKYIKINIALNWIDKEKNQVKY